LKLNKHIWIKKATGLGVTEFILRYMAWLCIRDNVLSGSQMCIVVGPNIEKAIELIKRLKDLFLPKLGVTFDTKETVIELNGVHIEAYPSHHIDAMRSLTSPRFILIDEGDFFPPGQQQDARDVSERYIAKSNPHIVMVAPDGLFDRIEREPIDKCLYKRVLLDYTYGLGRIYTEDEIAEAKRSPSFEREYNLKYLGIEGNVFHTKDIVAAIERGKKDFDIKFSAYTKKSMGLDPSFGSSNFGICITELRDGLVHVLHAEEYHRPDYDTMIETAINLLHKYQMTFEGGSRIFVDGANPEVIRSLKSRLYEDIEYQEQIDRWKSENGANKITLKWLSNNMFVLPVHFSKYHKEMLAHTKKLMEYDGGAIAINEKNTKLITALRTAVEKGEGSLDKEATSYDDIFDAFRMCLLRWNSKG
jgi:hypothetical protein